MFILRKVNSFLRGYPLWPLEKIDDCTYFAILLCATNVVSKKVYMEKHEGIPGFTRRVTMQIFRPRRTLTYVLTYVLVRYVINVCTIHLKSMHEP